jgi:hypothetical protein
MSEYGYESPMAPHLGSAFTPAAGAVMDILLLPGFGEAALPVDLVAYAGAKTSGVLVRADGSQVPLLSGVDGPAAALPKGTPGMNGLTRTHVEGHAAAIVRAEGLEGATLYINRAPCAGKAGCAAMFERMVPKGSKLLVYVSPGGSGGRLLTYSPWLVRGSSESSLPGPARRHNCRSGCGG